MRIVQVLSLVPLVALLSCGKGEVVDVSDPDNTQLYVAGITAQTTTGYSQIILDSSRIEQEWGQNVPINPISSSDQVISSSSGLISPSSSSAVIPPSSSSALIPPSSSSVVIPPSSSSAIVPPSSSSAVIPPSSSSAIVPPSSSSTVVPPSSSSAPPPSSSSSTPEGPVTLSAWDTFAAVPTGTNTITLAVTAPEYYTGTTAIFRCERASGAESPVVGSLVVGAESFSLNDWSPAPGGVPLTGTGTITTDQPISCKIGH